MFLMKMVGITLSPMLTAVIRGFSYEALVKDIIENINRSPKPCITFQVKMLACLLAMVCNYSKNCLSAGLLILLSLLLQNVS